MIRTRVLRADPTLTRDGDGHTVTVRLVGWDEPDDVTDDGRTRYTESFARSGLKVIEDRLLAEREHNGPLVASGNQVDDREDGLYATVRISRSSVGRDLVADMDAGMYQHVSVDFDDDPTPAAAGAHVVRTGATLRRFAFTNHPQHAGARVVGRRSNPGDTMTTATATPTEDTTPAVDPAAPAAAPVAAEPAPAPVPAVEAAAPAAQHQRSAPPRPGQPRLEPVRAGGRFRSFGHFALAAANGDIEAEELGRYQRALDPATTADMTGLIHDQWITEIIDLQRTMTPAIEEFASRPLPAEGDTVRQPRVKVRPLAGVQAVENTQISSRAVEIEGVSWELQTFAGGQNMSIQSVKRSSPSYLNEVMRLHLIEMVESKNAAVVTDLEALDYTGRKVDKSASYASGEFNDDLVDVAAGMLNTLKRFPEVVLIATNVWVSLAKAKDADGRPIYPTVSPMNPAGALSLTSSSGVVRDLSYRVEPELTDDTILVGVREAYRTFSGGVETLTADTPSTLGRDVAIYSFCAMGEVDPRGLWQISPAVV